MNWFEEFSEFTWFTIALLAVALLGGIFALIKRDKAKPIMAIAGIAEIIIIAAAFITGRPFEGVDRGSGLYIVIIAILIIVMALIMIISGRKDKWGARDIAYAAMCVAMSFILSCIKLFTMPQGGTITPASLLPMMVYTAAFGPARGLVVGCAYGLLQLFQGAYVIHPMQMLVDYPMAFGALALGGFANYIKMPERLKLPAAVVLGYIGRYIMAVLSGVIFFAEYAGDQGALIYSLVYNISYLGPDCVVCALVALIPGFGRLINMLKKR